MWQPSANGGQQSSRRGQSVVYTRRLWSDLDGVRRVEGMLGSGWPSCGSCLFQVTLTPVNYVPVALAVPRAFSSVLHSRDNSTASTALHPVPRPKMAL
jgi:hypothetical protein